jgi:probable HAF family extracellular repeat protein
MVGLGVLPGHSYSAALGVSADGPVVAGTAYVDPISHQAFLWTEAGGMVGLGDLPGGTFTSEALAASADGSVVVGSSSSASGDSEAFR